MRNTDLREDLIPSGSKVLCAVSGGADSMCLLHMLSRREDISLAAAHFNHQLRGRRRTGTRDSSGRSADSGASPLPWAGEM